jgi:hypothetical protein
MHDRVAGRGNHHLFLIVCFPLGRDGSMAAGLEIPSVALRK